MLSCPRCVCVCLCVCVCVCVCLCVCVVNMYTACSLTHQLFTVCAPRVFVSPPPPSRKRGNETKSICGFVRQSMDLLVRP